VVIGRRFLGLLIAGALIMGAFTAIATATVNLPAVGFPQSKATSCQAGTKRAIVRGRV
jgi:hypothetical protein